jgi:hypothetical protein
MPCDDDIVLLFCPTSQMTRDVVTILPTSGNQAVVSTIARSNVDLAPSPPGVRRSPNFARRIRCFVDCSGRPRRQPTSTVHGVVFDIFAVWPQKPCAGQRHRSLLRSEK